MAAPQPFKVSIADAKINEMMQLIAVSKIALPTYESQQQDRRYGITTDWLQGAKAAWLEFDWYALTHVMSLYRCQLFTI